MGTPLNRRTSHEECHAGTRRIGACNSLSYNAFSYKAWWDSRLDSASAMVSRLAAADVALGWYAETAMFFDEKLQSPAALVKKLAAWDEL